MLFIEITVKSQANILELLCINKIYKCYWVQYLFQSWGVTCISHFYVYLWVRTINTTYGMILLLFQNKYEYSLVITVKIGLLTCNYHKYVKLYLIYWNVYYYLIKLLVKLVTFYLMIYILRILLCMLYLIQSSL